MMHHVKAKITNNWQKWEEVGLKPDPHLYRVVHNNFYINMMIWYDCLMKDELGAIHKVCTLK